MQDRVADPPLNVDDDHAASPHIVFSGGPELGHSDKIRRQKRLFGLRYGDAA